MTAPLLEIQHLSLAQHQRQRVFPLLDDLSFSIYPGEIVGLVGESGCGKSLTASAILGLLPPTYRLQGRLVFEGRDMLAQTPSDWLKIRGTRLGLILQDPSSALNPLLPIGQQLIEGLCYHKKLSYAHAFEKGIKWLTRVGITEARHRMRQYPHEMSGGMKQRVLIAMALICQPSLLIADEPTTALDVTVQAQILELLKRLQKEEGMSMLLITHDLGVVAHCCQRVLVMYAGQLVEMGKVQDVFNSPQHPYTQALLQCRRHLESFQDASLTFLDGFSPSLQQRSTGCRFVARCSSAMRICQGHAPAYTKTTQGYLRCWLPQATKEHMQ